MSTIRILTKLLWPGCAQGRYAVRAKGFILAVLSWGTSEGPLPGWGPFAYVPIDPAGNGSFVFPGMRAIPRGATHVWARCHTPDFSAHEDANARIPDYYAVTDEVPRDACRITVLTDIHHSSRPWRTRRALRSAEGDIILLLGDSTNDGLPEQFAAFAACVNDVVPGKAVFPVIGNHDVPRDSRCGDSDGWQGYADFQGRLLAGAEDLGYDISYDSEGRAYAVRIGHIDVAGLQCVMSGRRFLFPKGSQLDWLEGHLSSTAAAWHLVLCHAPLLAHNPNRNTGTPYLGGDRRLQEIVDKAGGVVFLSGHTHVSPNVLVGNGEYDVRHRNVYLDCGSVVATDTSGEKGLMSPDWKDGCKAELTVWEDGIEVCMSSIESGVRFPRGCYRFPVGPSA